MLMSSKKKSNKKLLPTKTIESASRGDADAMREVINHYSGYIIALSTVRLHDDDGNSYLFIDETLRSDLELRLITKVVGFEFKSSA
jgi:hypothetical protein